MAGVLGGRLPALLGEGARGALVEPRRRRPRAAAPGAKRSAASPATIASGSTRGSTSCRRPAPSDVAAPRRPLGARRRSAARPARAPARQDERPTAIAARNERPAEAVGPGARGVREPHLALARHDQHQPGRDEVGPVGTLGPPARVVGDLHQQRVARPARGDRSSSASTRRRHLDAARQRPLGRRAPGVRRAATSKRGSSREDEERRGSPACARTSGRTASRQRRRVGAHGSEGERLDVPGPRVAQAVERVGRDAAPRAPRRRARRAPTRARRSRATISEHVEEPQALERALGVEARVAAAAERIRRAGEELRGEVVDGVGGGGSPGCRRPRASSGPRRTAASRTSGSSRPARARGCTRPPRARRRRRRAGAR